MQSHTESSAVFVRLSTLGVTTVTGKDAPSFLHGQFTNRIHPIVDRAPLAGYCSPKGRLLATFRVWAEGDRLFLLTPKSVEPDFIKRLRMFVLRADVKFSTEDDRTLMACIGKAAEEDLKKSLATCGKPLPEVDKVIVTETMTVIRVADAPAVDGLIEAVPRYLILTQDPAGFSATDDESQWWASEIAAGIGSVFPETRERFVPQSINYELTGGVVFNKGCYPGQEVVSRIQHLGAPSRRMAIGFVSDEEGAKPGDGVYTNKDGTATLSGDVVLPLVKDGRTWLLFSLPTNDLTLSLSLDETGTRTVTVLPLPYELRNILRNS